MTEQANTAMVNKAEADRFHNIMPAITVARQPIHTRRIEMQGFKRSDGLWDIEGWLQDTKDYDFDNMHRGQIRAGDPLHQMRLRLTIDDDMVIKDAHAVSNATPYNICDAITVNYYQKLVGEKIAAGFSKKVKTIFQGVAGCTHLTDMVIMMATVAYQTVISARVQHGGQQQSLMRLVNSCHGFNETGAVVQAYKELWQEKNTNQDDKV